MMDTNKMREEFEAWQAKETPGADLAHCGALIGEGPARESYRNMYVAERWIGWQASRAAIVIEFPLQTPYVEYYDDVEGGCFDYPKYLADVKAGIVAQGLQCGVKS